MGSRRAATLRAGALRGAALERLREVSPEDALGRLQSLPGVGPWTANHVAKNALGWADAVPVGDAHAHYTVTEALTGVQGDDEAMLRALDPPAPSRPGGARRGRGVRRPRPAVGAQTSAAAGQHHRREPWRY